MNKARQILIAIARWLFGNLVWDIATLAIAALARALDPLGLAATTSQILVLFVYLLTGLGGAVILYGAWRLLAKFQKQSFKSASKWTLTPHDFGLDSQGVHRVGFRIIEPQGDYDVALERFWLSTRNRLPAPLLQYHLNLTSHRVKKTADRIFVLAESWQHAYPFTLVMDDGVYGLFVLDGYYKARISIRDTKTNKETCFDVLIEFNGNDSIKVDSLIEVGCSDPQDKVLPKDIMYDESSNTWSTWKTFQPNLMYRS